MKLLSILFVFLFLVFPSTSFAGSACSSSWQGVASKQGWLASGVDGQSVGYCTLRLPTSAEVDALSKDCGEDRELLNQWIASTQNMNCTKLNMATRKNSYGNLEAYPKQTEPTQSVKPKTTPTETITPQVTPTPTEAKTENSVSLEELTSPRNLSVLALGVSLTTLVLFVLNRFKK